MASSTGYERMVIARPSSLPGFVSDGRLAMYGIGLAVAFLALYPLGWLVYGSLLSAPPLQEGQLTWANYVRAYADPRVYRTLVNTLVFAIGQTAFAVVLGALLGWIVKRTNTPGRRAFEFLILILFLMPLILAVVAWTMLLSPARGLINNVIVGLFGLDGPPFDIYSMGGMIFVQGLYVTPLAFLMISPSLASLDAGLEEAARMSGASPARVLFKVTLPLVMPAIASTSVLLFIIGLESFDVPQLLGAPNGIYTYTSLIFFEVMNRYPPDYGVGSSLATSLLVVTAVAVYLYRRLTARVERFETVRGKGYRAGTIDLGAWRWVTFAFCSLFFFFTVILPLCVLILGSLLQYYGTFSWAMFGRMSLVNYSKIFAHPTLVQGFWNSLVLAVGAGAITVVLAAIISYISIRSRLPGRGILEGVAMLPISFPATVLGLALLWAYIGIPLPIYGTVLILAIAYVTRYLPVALRSISGGMIQLSEELDEAARISGASWFGAFRRIILPLLKPTLFATWLILFMIFFRELAMSILLAGIGNPVISVVLYDFYQSGESGPLSAAAVLILVFIVVFAGIVRVGFRAGVAPGQRSMGP